MITESINAQHPLWAVNLALSAARSADRLFCPSNRDGLDARVRNSLIGHAFRNLCARRRFLRYAVDTIRGAVR